MPKPSFGTSKTTKTKKSRQEAKSGTKRKPSAPNQPSEPTRKQSRCTKSSPAVGKPTVSRRSSRGRGPVTEEVSKELALAADIVLSVEKNVWWRVLADPNGEDDVAIGSRQEWRDILPVFLKSGLISTIMTEGQYRLEFRERGWEALKLHLSMKHRKRLQYTAMQVNGSRSYYFVVGQKPKYIHPFKQAEAVAKDGLDAVGITNIGMRRNTRSNEHDDRDLEDKLCKYREEVRAAFLTDSLKQLEEMDDEELQEVIERAGKLANDFKETMKNGKESSKGKVSEAAEENPADEEAVEMEDEHEHDDVPDAEAADEQQSWAAVVKEHIDAALALDLTVRPRPKRNGQQGEIEADENKRQTNERERYLVIHLARIWGYDNPALTWKERQQIAAAACRQIAYDHGFAKSTGTSQVHTWDKALREGITSGTTDPLKSEHKGSTSATDKIETEHPGYLHELYRYAIRTIGITAGFEEITSSMNEKSATPLEQRPTLSLHYLQVLRWFEKNGGKEKSGKEKPRLTDDHKRRRVAWVKKWKEYFLLEDCPVANIIQYFGLVYLFFSLQCTINTSSSSAESMCFSHIEAAAS